jgi:soluble cytochrome b562
MGTHEQLMLQVKAANNAEEDKEESAPAAQFLLDMVCNLYHSKQAKYTDSQRYEKLRYDMLIAAIDGALPMHNSAMVSSSEGCRHLDLMSSLVIMCNDICVTAR